MSPYYGEKILTVFLPQGHRFLDLYHLLSRKIHDWFGEDVAWWMKFRIHSILYWKLKTNLNQSFGLSVYFNFLEPWWPYHRWRTSCCQYKHIPLHFPSAMSPLPSKLALLWGHSLLWLHFGCCCRGRGRSGRRGGGRGWTPSGLYARACHLQLPSFCEGSVVDAFQKEALSLTAVESLMREETEKNKLDEAHLTSFLREIRCTVQLPCRWRWHRCGQ